MAQSQEAIQVAYLLSVISSCSEFKPDWRKVAADTSISNANNAQKRFKAMVEKGDQYKLVNGKVVKAADVVPATPAAAVSGAAKTPSRPKKRKSTSANTTPSAKRSRKGQATTDAETNDNGDVMTDEDFAFLFAELNEQ